MGKGFALVGEVGNRLGFGLRGSSRLGNGFAVLLLVQGERGVGVKVGAELRDRALTANGFACRFGLLQHLRGEPAGYHIQSALCFLPALVEHLRYSRVEGHTPVSGGCHTAIRGSVSQRKQGFLMLVVVGEHLILCSRALGYGLLVVFERRRLVEGFALCQRAGACLGGGDELVDAIRVDLVRVCLKSGGKHVVLPCVMQ